MQEILKGCETFGDLGWGDRGKAGAIALPVFLLWLILKKSPLQKECIRGEIDFNSN
jgi:hypothetical protein